jgi:hypothetical protein
MQCVPGLARPDGDGACAHGESHKRSDPVLILHSRAAFWTTQVRFASRFP